MRKYCAVPVAELTEEMAEGCITTSAATAPVYGGYAILKFTGEKPSALSAYDEMNGEEVTAFISDKQPPVGPGGI